MDNKTTLTVPQIEELRYYIRTKGFVEPVQIQEILDHFACKVEEILEKDTSLSLQQAMQQAHHSFGVSGFRPIIRELDKSLKQKYSKIYWQTMKQLFLSVKWLPLIIFIGLFGFELTKWAEQSGLNKEWDINVGVWTMMGLFTISRLALAIITGTINREKNNYYIKYGMFFGGSFPFIMFLCYMHTPIKYLAAVCIVTGVCFMFILLHTIASYKAMQYAMNDYKEFSDRENGRFSAAK